MMRVSGPTSKRATSYSDNHIARESELFLKKKYRIQAVPANQTGPLEELISLLMFSAI